MTKRDTTNTCKGGKSTLNIYKNSVIDGNISYGILADIIIAYKENTLK
jgi:hypothetical protein